MNILVIASLSINVVLFICLILEHSYGNKMRNLFYETMDKWHKSDDEWKRICKDILLGRGEDRYDA